MIKTRNKVCCQIVIYVNYWVNEGSRVVYLCNCTFDISQRVPGEKDRHTFLWNVHRSRVNIYMVLELLWKPVSFNEIVKWKVLIAELLKSLNLCIFPHPFSCRTAFLHTRLWHCYPASGTTSVSLVQPPPHRPAPEWTLTGLLQRARPPDTPAQVRHRVPWGTWHKR